MSTSPMSAEQLVELVNLMKGSDSVELKLTVDHSQFQLTEDSLGFDELEAQIRQVVFFDTPDLELHGSGVGVRARRIQGGQGDTVVKLRPVTPSQLPPKVRESKHLGIETDVTRSGFVCSASMKGETTAVDVRRVILGRDRIKGLFSKKQRAFFGAYAPDGVKWSDLVVLGPIFVLKLKTIPPGFDHRLVGEMWAFPDDSRVLELSTRCKPEEALQLAAKWQVELTKLGIDLSGNQPTKTATALEYFSSRL